MTILVKDMRWSSNPMMKTRKTNLGRPRQDTAEQDRVKSQEMTGAKIQGEDTRRRPRTQATKEGKTRQNQNQDTREAR